MTTPPVELADLLRDPARAAEIPPEQIPALLAQLAAIQSALAARLLVVNGQGSPEALAEDRWLTIPEVAERLCLARAYCYELARRGDLPTVRVGKYLRVSLAALREWTARHQEKGLDMGLRVTHSNRHDGLRGSQTPKAAGADPSATRRTARRDRQQRGPLGAGRPGHPGVGRPAPPARGPDGVNGQA